MKRYLVLATLPVAFPSAALAAQPAADTSASEDGTSSIGDIIVTARRREERLQDVPVAVSALTGAALEQKAVVSIQDMNRIAPSLNISQSPGSGRNLFAITIRGQRQADTVPSLDPSVGVYMGDLLVKRLYGVNDILFDLSTVEVLKGPQGTLFGLNVTGGNVIFRPNLPTDRFEASLELGLGNYDARTVQGFVNVPLGEGAALRVSGQYRKRDGYIRNVLDGKREQDEDGGGIRAALRLEPVDGLVSTFVTNYARRSTTGTGHHFDTIRPGSTVDRLYGAAGQEALALSQSLGYYEVAHDVDGYARTAPAWDISNTTSYEVSDNITLKAIVGYRYYKASQFDDVDGGPLSILHYGFGAKGKDRSAEFQILGEQGGLNWIAGAYYFREKVEVASFTTAILSPYNTSATPYEVHDNSTNTSKSLFASATQKLDFITDNLSLTLGGRYTWDDRNARFGTINSIGLPNQRCAFDPATDPDLANFDYDPATCLVNLEKSFGKFTYTASLDYKFAPGKMIYVVHRRGYRSGGFSSRGTRAFTLAAIRPEIVEDYEVGLKLDWRLGGGALLQTNFAAYRQNYTDMQRNTPTVDPATNLVASVVRNAGKARIEGLEFEGNLLPVDWLELSGHVSYTNPRYLEFLVPVAPTAANPNPAPLDVTGTASFGGVPKWQMRATLRLKAAEIDGVGRPSVDLTYYHQTKFIMQDRLDYQPEGTVPGFTVWNLRADFDGFGGVDGLRLGLFVNNLLDKKYAMSRNSLASEIGFADYTAAPPRMYGMTLRYSFGD